jgi:sigma-B regulation protein RsbU (phosphoserine phosphatase)
MTPRTKVNVYNTTDPATLLELKREEAKIMLEVVRSIHPNMRPQELINTVVLVIIKQLDVNKLILVTNLKDQKKIEFIYNFPSLQSNDLSFLDQFKTTTPVTDHQEFELLQQIHAEYIIPLGRKEGGHPTAWFIIADFAESEAETLNDIIFIETLGNIMAISLENIYLFEEKVAKELIHQELEVAGRIQKQSLPSTFDHHEQLDIYAYNLAHYKVAGDFYDVIPINQDELYFCIADVSGKGIAAALLVATLQANLRALVQSSTSFHLIIKQLHNVIGRITRSEHFVTLFLGRLNVRSMKMAYINAGHNPPFIVRNGTVKELVSGCIPLGILPIENIEIGYEQMQEGDVLFMYTDGIVEQFNPTDEMIGLESIHNHLCRIYKRSAKDIIENVLEMVWNHADTAANSDDMSLMVIKILA